jgi:hypothetical protein
LHGEEHYPTSPRGTRKAGPRLTLPRLHVWGDVTDPALVRSVLERLGITYEAPPIARARDPTLLSGE